MTNLGQDGSPLVPNKTGCIGVLIVSTEKPRSSILAEANSLAPQIPSEKEESAETLGKLTYLVNALIGSSRISLMI
jgi:hypothetical protein